MVGLGSPLAEGIQTDQVHSAQETGKQPEQAVVLSPMEVLTLFCQAPVSAEALSSKKVLKLVDELIELHDNLAAFLIEQTPKTSQRLLTQIDNTTLDLSILYFAAELWRDPDTGMKVRDAIEKSPPTSSSGKFLNSLLKPLSKEESVLFWKSLGEAPPKMTRAFPAPKRVSPRAPLPKRAPMQPLRIVK